jgi:hypothetical protein
LSNSTGYSPVEKTFDWPIPGLFERLLKKSSERKPPFKILQERILRPQVMVKENAVKEKERRRRMEL